MGLHLKRIMIVATMAVLAVTTPLAAAADEYQWDELTFKEALVRARDENKHIFLDMYTTWCSPCKMLDRETYTDARVHGLLDGMIALKIDSEKGEGIEVTKDYRVSFWPTMLFLDPQGKEVDRLIGFHDADEFVEAMNNYINGIETVAWYEKKVTQDPEDAASWKVLGQKYVDAGRAEEARNALSTYLRLVPNLAGEEKAELMYSLGEVSYTAESYGDAVTAFEKLLAEFGTDDWKDACTQLLARSYHKIGKSDDAVAVYQGHVARHPDDPKALNGLAWFCATRKVGLDAALPVALKAVELTGRDPGYLDTLAELHYARGEFDKAIEVGREAEKKQPDDPYFKEQVEKFEKAKEDADSQAKR